MAIQYWMDFTVFFQDASEYNLALTTFGGNTYAEITPADAASRFGITVSFSDNPNTDPKGFQWGLYVPGYQIGTYPDGLGTPIVINDFTLSYTVFGRPWGSNPPGNAPAFPAGPDTTWTWCCNLVLVTAAGVGTTPPATAIAQRRWSIGYESANNSEGGNFPSTALSKDFSRVPDGSMGYGIRGQAFSSFTINVNAFRAITPTTSWERHYVRYRATGSNGLFFWEAHGNNALSGVALFFRSTGNVEVYNISTAGVTNLRGVVHTPVLNTWYRYDIFLKFATGGGTSAIFSIYINGVFAMSFTDNTTQGMNASANHLSTEIGRIGAGADQDTEIDIDDSVCSDLPSNVDASTLAFTNTNYSADWLLGSHIRRAQVIPSKDGNLTSMTNWTPNSYGNLNQGQNPIRGADGVITSTTALAQIQGVTDAQALDEAYAMGEVNIGVVSGTINSNSSNSGGTDGQLGYRQAAGAIVQSTVNQLNVLFTNAIGFLPSGLFAPTEVSPWILIKTKSNDGNTDTNRSLGCSLEYLGVWGPEDNPAYTIVPSRLTNLHNCPYFNSPWGAYMAPAPSYIFSVGGTYTGNSTTQRIALPGPCQFLWIRRVGGAGGGVLFSTSIGFAPIFSRLPTPNIRLFMDNITGVFYFEVNGVAPELNLNATTYQYIAFCDPESRFNLCGAFSHANGSTTPKVNPLINPLFLAEGGFVQRNELDSAAGGDGVWWKGPGIGSNVFRHLTNGNSLANGGNFSIGAFNTLADMHPQVAEMAYSLWSTIDAAGCGVVMIQMLTYTGNGASPRNIPLTPTSSRFPLFVMVVPNTGAIGRWRDPSHAGATSGDLSSMANDGGNGITAVAMDQITVQSALNANGVVYSVFAICGSTTSMMNGTFWPPYCDTPPGSPRIDPDPPSGINIMMQGGIMFNGSPAMLLLKDISGIYTLQPGKTSDTLYDRQTGQTSVERPILGSAKTGYIGG